MFFWGHGVLLIASLGEVLTASRLEISRVSLIAVYLFLMYYVQVLLVKYAE